MAKIRTTITLDKELFKELAAISKEEQRFSNQVVYLVKKGKEAIEKVETCRTES